MGNAVITVAGKGGVGKTSISAAIVRQLVRDHPDARILAIDADPAVGLATALAVQVSETIDDIARITVLRTEDITKDGEQAAFAIIKGIETKKYGVYPEGYMIRASAFSNREQARVSRKALERGLTFEQVGNLFIRQYRRSRFVRAAKVIFITLPQAPYRDLDSLAARTDKITGALNHILDDVDMDCRACEWKPVCDEVGGLKEVHGIRRRRGS